MRYILILLVFVALVLNVSPCLAAPALVFEAINHDFGEITQGETLTYTYRFHNNGDQVLEIGQLRSSCGCTAALISTRRLEPGMMGELQLSFDSHGFRDRVHKTVSFDTNDPNHPTVTLILEGLVKAELFVSPQRINWGRVKAGTALRTIVDVVNNSAQEITLRSPTTTNPDIAVLLSAETIAAGETVSLEVTANFPQKTKRLAGYVILLSNFPAVPELKVPVSARLSAN